MSNQKHRTEQEIKLILDRVIPGPRDYYLYRDHYNDKKHEYRRISGRCQPATLPQLYSQAEVAKMLGISRQAVDQIEKKAIYKIRCALLCDYTTLTGRKISLA